MAPASGGGRGTSLGGILVDLDRYPYFETVEDPFIPTGMTAHQVYVLRCTSLAVSTLTLVSCGVVIYWFANMRRSFRHDLIMLLIVSDSVEALFFFIFPLRYLASGSISSYSAFCQASGFFLSLGIESSDIAVALIAIHTGFYIFKPTQSSGQSGLYAYRYIAFAAFLLLPVLFASLAFINYPAYTNNGSYCYLPAEPRWPRFALSWVPRYIILLLIVVIYGCIYVYVTILMRRFGQQSDMRGESSGAQVPGTAMRTNRTTGSVPPTPPIAYHGLIPSSSDSRADSYVEWERQRRGSVSSTYSESGHPNPRTTRAQSQPAPRRTSLVNALRWRWPKAHAAPAAESAPSAPPSPGGEQSEAAAQGSRRQGEPSEAPPSTAAASTAGTTPQQSVVHEMIAVPQPSVGADETGRGQLVVRRGPEFGSTSQRSLSHDLGDGSTTVGGSGPGGSSQTDPDFWHRPINVDMASDKKGSNPNMRSVLYRGPPRPVRQQRMASDPVDPADPTPRREPPADVSGSTGTTSSSNFVPPHMSSDPAGMKKARVKIRRQLRMLFLYPLVYILVWVIPFIMHIFRWDDPSAAGPFGLQITSLISLCIQGFADAVLFGILEKPWRHSRRPSVSSTGSFFRRRSSAERHRGWFLGAKDYLVACLGEKWHVINPSSGGRTREEMLMDGRIARLRREIEVAEYEERQAGPRKELEWWEWLDNFASRESVNEDMEGLRLDTGSPTEVSPDASGASKEQSPTGERNEQAEMTSRRQEP